MSNFPLQGAQKRQQELESRMPKPQHVGAAIGNALGGIAYPSAPDVKVSPMLSFSNEMARLIERLVAISGNTATIADNLSGPHPAYETAGGNQNVPMTLVDRFQGDMSRAHELVSAIEKNVRRIQNVF